MKKCDSYHLQPKTRYTYHPLTGRPIGHDVEVGVCRGTKEEDKCDCGGDRTKCDFYPEVRESVNKESEEIITNAEGVMEMKDVNSIAICRDNYSTREEWEDAIKKMVVALLDSYQIMMVRYDEPGLGIVEIEFNPSDAECGCKYPYWLSPEEAESVVYDDEQEENV